MSPPPVQIRTEELLDQVSWIRSLALRVAGDAHIAEDLTQDTLLIALRSARSRPYSLRQWLASVLRNVVRTRRRSDQRRADREARHACTERAPSTHELVERASLQRELVGALLELEEPYRSTLLMRFFEERSQAEISAEMGVPASTVGTRVAEGVRRLRRRFAGQEETWLSSLLAFLCWPKDVAATSSGALVVGVKAKVAFASFLVLVTALLWKGLNDHEPDFQPHEHATEIGLVQERHAEESIVGEVREERMAVLSESPINSSAARAFHDIPEHAGLHPPELRTLVVRGKVIDVTRLPVPNTEVASYRPGGGMIVDGGRIVTRPLYQNSVRTDARGRFEIEARAPFELGVRDSQFVSVFQPILHEHTDEEVTVVVARRAPFAGMVVESNGTPLAGVSVNVQTTFRMPEGEDATRPLLETKTDALGRFELEDVPDVESGVASFTSPGFLTEIVPVPDGGDGAMRIVMTRDNGGLYTIRGHVMLAGGEPANEALVSTGVMAVPTDDEGYFVIDFEPWLDWRVDKDAPTVVTAIQPGSLPASVTLPSVNDAREEGWPEDLVIELEGEPLSISGLVVDKEGTPLRGLLIEPVDMTEFGAVRMEGMGGFSGMPKTNEQIAGSGEATTDVEGRFELDGLSRRSYRLCVFRRPSLLCTITDPIEAGRGNVRIVFDRRALGTIAGRVVDRHGEGIPSVRVSVSRKRLSELVIGSSATTNAEGFFEIENATTEPEFLRIEGDGIVPELFRELGEGENVARLELVVGRRCRTRFELGDWPTRADELVVIDEGGDELTMMRVSRRGMSVHPKINFAQYKPDLILAVPDAATHAVIRKDGEEVTRVPLKLRSDELNVVRM